MAKRIALPVLICGLLIGCAQPQRHSLETVSRYDRGRARGVVRTDYLGWDNCYKITNGQAEVVIVPAIGRAASFRFHQGENVFLFYEKHGGRLRDELSQYTNFGGLYTWLAPQVHWSKTEDQQRCRVGMATPFDGLDSEVVAIDHYSVTIARRDSGTYGLTMEKTYTLDPVKPQLTYRVRVFNDNPVPVRWSVWNLIAPRPEGKVVVEAPNGWDDFHFLFRTEDSAQKFRPYVGFVDGLAVMNFDAMDLKERKAFIHPAGRYVAHAMRDVWLLRTFLPPAPGMLFTDNDSQIEIWADTPFFEIETLSPEVLIYPGSEYEWQEVLTLHPTGRTPFPSSPWKLRKVIEEILPKEPFIPEPPAATQPAKPKRKSKGDVAGTI
ncbi:MAG: DUF4380 domain-containing protein [Phycisphaerae bacterium]|nr:DUF4380 domain-containing protein [Phycisphaerae bacterium]